MGFELWGIEYLRNGKFSTLRIYIDHENGIDVDHCAEVSRQVSAVMDVEDPITNNYTLEVSSPGMDRPLFKLEQYQHSINEWVEIKLRHAFEGRKNFKGVITGVEGDEVVVQVDNEEFLLPIESIERGRIIPNFS
ncbi:ribosome maturation factor RimP [Reinekea thalattae]|uniref:Ribosome maturation factor RimP n=2 Tax=Reinekea thalattae TaxID=2593301 RepID=A0A5C8Z4J6_9GAMM|nr:ribosome maturation factor RimP [Reinekea thalattae]